MTYDEFCRENGLVLELTHIARRVDGLMSVSDDVPDGSHFNFAIKTLSGRVVVAGEYTQGIGHAERWARKNKSKFHGQTRDFLISPPPWNRRIVPSAQYWSDIRDKYGAQVVLSNIRLNDGRAKSHDKRLIDVSEIFQSCCMDAMDSDLPFSEWCDILGYSDDSIKARNIWNACNDIRRALNAAFGNSWEGLEE